MSLKNTYLSYTGKFFIRLNFFQSILCRSALFTCGAGGLKFSEMKLKILKKLISTVEGVKYWDCFSSVKRNVKPRR